MRFGTQNVAPLGQLQCRPSQVLLSRPIPKLLSPLSPTLSGWPGVGLTTKQMSQCHMFLLDGSPQLNVTCGEQPCFPGAGKLGEGKLVSDLSPCYFLQQTASICSLSLCIPSSQLTKGAERSHHVPLGPAHCPARRCRFSSHFSMDKKFWTMWKLSTNTPRQIQSWVTPL